MGNIEEILSHDERLRLEALAQSVSVNSMKTHTPMSEQIVSQAKVFEEYIQGGNEKKRG